MIGWKKVQIFDKGGNTGRTAILKVSVIGRIVKPEELAHLGWYDGDDYFHSQDVPKFRTNKLKVLAAFRPRTLEPVVLKKGEYFASSWDTDFRYKVGKVRKPSYFDSNPDIGCSSGLHFFTKRSHAEHWSL